MTMNILPSGGNLERRGTQTRPIRSFLVPSTQQSERKSKMEREDQPCDREVQQCTCPRCNYTCECEPGDPCPRCGYSGEE